MIEFRNLVEMQEVCCRKHGARPMYGVRGDAGLKWTTHGEFAVMVDETRGGLAGLGIARGDKVAVIAGNCLEWPVCAYAAYGLGAHYVPMYESQMPEEWEYIVRDSGAKILLARTPAILEKVRHLPGKVESLERIVLLRGEAPGFQTLADLRRAGRAAPVPSVDIDPAEPFGLIYTSGTTGKPKGVILTHANLMAELESVHDILEFRDDDVSLAFLPWGHLMGQIEEVHFLVYRGFSAAIVEDINGIMDDFWAVRPTIFFTVPKVYQRFFQAVAENLAAKGGLAQALFAKGGELADRARRGERLGPLERLRLAAARRLVFGKIRQILGGRLRMSLCGGAALNPEVIGFLENLGVIVYEGYGLTETTMAVAANTTRARRQGSVGRALGGVRIALDHAVEGAGPGEGEIVVHGPHVAAGYHNQAETFAQCIGPDGGFRTGDLGRLDDDGFLYITGRVKELYKLANGKYVAPAPLEEELRQSPHINHAMIYGDNRDFNVLLVVPEASALDGRDTEAARLLLHAEVERLGGGFKPYEKPRKIAVIEDEWSVENGLLTPTLKIKRPRITQRYMTVIEDLYRI